MAGTRVPFVGRSGELTTLAGLADRVLTQGAAAAALVAGDPGSGKSRLLAEACDRAGFGRRFDVRGHEPERMIPLAAARDLFERLGRHHREGSTLQALLSGRRAAAGGLDVVQLFEAAHRCVSGNDPTVVVVDNVQWLDELTVALCHYLLRAARASEQPVLLLAAGREEPAVSAFGEAVARSVGPDRWALVSLGPLDVDAGVELAMRIAPQLDGDRAAAMWTRARGSPFWLESLATGNVDADGLAARMAVLDDDASSVVRLLCVARRPLTVADAAAVLDWDEARTRQPAARLRDRGILTQRAGVMAFAHDLVRQAADETTATTSTRDLHERMARWLARVAHDDPALLWEALGHRAPSDPEAVALARRIVALRHRHPLGDDGVRRLMSIAEATDPKDLDALELRRDVAVTATELGVGDMALTAWSGLADRAADAGDRAWAALGASRAAFELGRGDESVAWLRRADVGDAGDAALVIERDVQRARMRRWHGHDNAEAQVFADRALTRARSITAAAGATAELDSRQRAAYLSALGAAFDTALLAEHVDELEIIANEMVDVARGVGEEDLKATISAGVLLRQMGRFAEAEARFRQASLEAHRRFLPRVEVEAAFWLAYTCYTRGQLLDARLTAAQASALAGRVGTPVRMALSWAHALVSLLELSLGNWQSALGVLHDLRHSEPDAHYRLLVSVWLGVWLARYRTSTATDEVRALLTVGQADASIAGCDRCRREFTIRMAESLARTGAVDDARALLADWDVEQVGGYALSRFYRSWVGALIEARDGDAAAAAHALDALIVDARRMDMVVETLWLGLDLAATLAASDRDRTIAILRTVDATARRIGASSEQQTAQRALRGVGVRTWQRLPRPGGATTGTLTRRELEVAQLVAAGASNPEIAAALFVSRKTVERHVSNILSKQGLKNRTQLAARMSERRGEHASGMGELPDDPTSQHPYGPVDG